MKRITGIFIFLLILHTTGFCTYLEEANELLLHNKPEEALILLEKALIENPSNEEIYINLAFVYDMLGNPKKSLEILKNGLSYAGELKYKFYFNMGNNHYILGRNQEAVDMFTKSIEYNSQFAEPHLNRASAKLKLSFKLENMDDKVKSYEEIIKDYETYLVLMPGSPKQEDVEKMIAALRKRIRDKEQREKDLENLLDILNSSTDSTKDITAGAEDIDVEYEEEDILD